jgi:hypothetical protein
MMCHDDPTPGQRATDAPSFGHPLGHAITVMPCHVDASQSASVAVDLRWGT